MPHGLIYVLNEQEMHTACRQSSISQAFEGHMRKHKVAGRAVSAHAGRLIAPTWLTQVRMRAIDDYW